MNKEIKKYLNELVAYMADDLHLEGLPDKMSRRACQLSDAADILKEHLEGEQSKKETKIRLKAMELEIGKKDCYLWERMPAP
tara:strand:- start:334 stop:579 length:246 start_codon:yes stop_codon:yes gene_type:complete